MGPGKGGRIALRSGSAQACLNKSGREVCIDTITSLALPGTGSRRMGPLSGPPRGETEAGPNPTDRAKPGVKDPLLIEGRGVPLRVVSTAANVNEGPVLSVVLNSLPIVRPQPAPTPPHPLGLDAAFDNAPARTVLVLEQ